MKGYIVGEKRCIISVIPFAVATLAKRRKKEKKKEKFNRQWKALLVIIRVIEFPLCSDGLQFEIYKLNGR